MCQEISDLCAFNSLSYRHSEIISFKSNCNVIMPHRLHIFWLVFILFWSYFRIGRHFFCSAEEFFLHSLSMHQCRIWRASSEVLPFGYGRHRRENQSKIEKKRWSNASNSNLHKHKFPQSIYFERHHMYDSPKTVWIFNRSTMTAC